MTQNAKSTQRAQLLVRGGLLLMLVAAGLAGWQWFRLSHLHRVMGHVEEITQARQPDGSLRNETHVGFLAPSLTGMRFVKMTVPPTFFGADLKAGEAAPVAYACCDTPQNPEIVTWGRVYGLAITLGLVGMIIFDVGFVLLLRERIGSKSDRQVEAEHNKNRSRYAHFFGGSDSQRPFDHE